MKIYISADMEGTTGVVNWDEVDHQKALFYKQFQKKMTNEVAAACKGANDAGANEVWVKDAHYSGRNILQDYLPKNTKLIRGWSGHPYFMVQELDDSFDALVMIGYHSRASSGGNPLAHTMSSSKIEKILINDQAASEFFLHGNIASKYEVPLVFLSGDAGICDEVKKVSPNTIVHATMVGVGDSTVSIHPEQSTDSIRSKVKKVLTGDFKKCLWKHPDHFRFQVRFIKQQHAYKASFFPGVSQLDPKTIYLETSDYDDIMKFILFNI
jgi:D-amino peptidase